MTLTRRGVLAGPAAVGLAGLVGWRGPLLQVPTAPAGLWGTVVAPGHNTIQAAVASGKRHLLLQDGEYTTDAVIGVGAAERALSVRGAGQRTRIRSTKTGTPLAAMVAVSGATDGVQLDGFVLDCDGKADVGLDLNSNGTTGNYQGEPDSVHRVRNLWVYDAVTSGVWLRGTDTQATELQQVRVRRAGVNGFLIQAPDNWLTNCEATTQSATAGAAFYVNGANNFLHGCKGWYARNYGFWVRATRCTFTNCHAQDTRNHGWYIEWDKNVFAACIADTAAMWDVGGTLNGADGWYVESGMVATSIQGCMGFDRRPSGAASFQRYGLNAPAAMLSPGANGQQLIQGFVGYDNATALINAR